MLDRANTVLCYSISPMMLAIFLFVAWRLHIMFWASFFLVWVSGLLCGMVCTCYTQLSTQQKQLVHAHGESGMVVTGITAFVLFLIS